MAWGVRQLGAAQAMGAPKGGGGRPQKPAARPPGRYLNKASGKMETGAQLKAYKAPNQNKHNANPGHGGHPQGAHPGPAPFDAESAPLWQLNPAQINQRGSQLAQQQLKGELSPYQNQSRELTASQQAAQARYSAFAGAQKESLAGLQGETAANAKTAENRAADLALKTGKAVEGAGQGEAGQVGGYVSPELKAQMLAAGQRASETSGASQSLAASQGQNSVDYMTKLRAAAALRVTEGASSLGANYAKALSENSNKQREAIGKLGPNAAKYGQELGKEAFNQKATIKGLGLKAEDMAQTAELAQAKNKTSENNSRRDAATARAKLGFERDKFGSDQEYKNAVLNYQKLGAESKSRYDKAAERYKRWQETSGSGSSGTSPSASQTGKVAQEVFTALSIAQRELGPKGKHGGWSKGQIDKVRQSLLTGKGKPDEAHNALTVSAALNLAVYGRLGPNDKARLRAAGVDPAAF